MNKHLCLVGNIKQNKQKYFEVYDAGNANQSIRLTNAIQSVKHINQYFYRYRTILNCIISISFFIKSKDTITIHYIYWVLR